METSKVTGERIKKYLQEGKRFDKRALDEFREITIEEGVSNQSEGSVRVKLGKTEVIVGIKMGIGEPYPDSPDKGNLMVTAELLPLSSERYEPGPPRFPAIEIGRLTDRFIRESGFIDLKELCIKKGEKVWTVFIDIYSINDDGNLLDAAGIGAIAALRKAKIPKYDDKKEQIVYGELTKENIPLMKENMLPITIHKIGKSLLVDPTLEEEDVSEARITIGATIEGSINSLQKGNVKEFTIEELEKALDMSEEIRKKIFKNIGSYLK